MKSSTAHVSKAPQRDLRLEFNDETAYLHAADEMGLTAEEARVAEKQLGRRPNRVELGMISAMWSEHCSYKSSRVFLKNFPTTGPKVLQGPGENAGIVDLGEGLALCFKIESHNHPSYIEPYQGAATGVGGILRDIFTMGARPLAFMNSLRFGDPQNAKTRYLLGGVVKGIGGYGNCVGIPTVGGEVYFDPAYQGNILVNAFCAGILHTDKIFRAGAQGVGNLVVYIGSKTGRDGIHGATMASDSFDAAALERRPTVQVGDPFTGKLLMEATLEMMAKNLVVGIQDMGAAGLTCSITEMSDKGGCGMDVDLDHVPTRELGMDPYEIMLSESQERMLLVCKPEKREAIFAVARHWGIDAAVIGKVVPGNRVHLTFQGETVVDLPPSVLTNDAPLYRRPTEAPAKMPVLKLETEVYAKNIDANALLKNLLGSANLSSRAWVYRQYDQHVGTNTVLRPGDDAAVLRIKDKDFGVAMCCDGNSFYCAADPYLGGMIAVAEAARNLACVGAEPLALTNCLNFGNPERPQIMWQFEQVVKGMTAACKSFDIPVISGNVSLYNQHDDADIPPTPVIGMCGKVHKLQRQPRATFQKAGQAVLLLGQVKPQKVLNGEVARYTQAEKFSAKQHDRLWPAAPQLDLQLEGNLHRALRAMIQEELLTTAHDCADGGLAVALAECCFGEAAVGAQVDLPANVAWNSLDLFTEEQSRVIVAVDNDKLAAVTKLAGRFEVPCLEMGRTGGSTLAIGKWINVKIDDLLAAWRGFFSRM